MDPELEKTTREFHSTETRVLNIYVINTLFGLTGLAIFVFNLLMILLYARVPKVRRCITFIMLQLFVFGMAHGFVIGVFGVTHRVLRNKLPDIWCVIGDLIMIFMEKYILFLLPLLVVERLVFIKAPYHSTKQRRKWSIIATIIITIATMLLAWIPIIPQLRIPVESHHLLSPEDAKNNGRYYDCQGLLNRRNIATPIILLIQQVLCVVIVVGVYVYMFYILKSRMTSSLPRMSDKRRKTLRRATHSVLLVAGVFFVTTVPFGISFQIRSLCLTGQIDKDLCSYITLKLRYAFGIISHLGDLFAPMMFAVFNPKIRIALRDFIGQPCGVRPIGVDSSSGPSSSREPGNNKESSNWRQKVVLYVPYITHWLPYSNKTLNVLVWLSCYASWMYKEVCF